MGVNTSSLATLWHRRNRKFDNEIRTELVYHLDRLTEANMELGMDPQSARYDAMLRFGPVEDVERDCVRIRRHGSPIHQLLRWFLLLLFLLGLFARFGGSDPNEIQIGNMLIAISIGTWLLLYVRNMSRASVVPRGGDPRPLRLG